MSSPPQRFQIGFEAAKKWKESDNKKEQKTGNISPECVLKVVEKKCTIAQMMHPTVPLCSCGDNIHRSFANPTHMFGSLVTNSERTERGQDSVISFNHTRLKIEEQDRTYFQSDFLHNHTRIMSMLDILEDDILPAQQLGVWRVKQTMKWARVNEKMADDFTVEVGHPSFYSMRYMAKAEKQKKEARDMMVQSAASLYLSALQLVNMAQSNEDEDLEEELIAQKNILRQTFVEEPWKDRNDECCDPGTRATITCLCKIVEVLV